ncbi:ATP-binding protein [Roseofilum reptotaenium CS-1145]|uniref:Circadian input-output histidine kinase CikA n=1 Tax=Roseofilum reptotaenium AO1-A TaxID=1925591 RepID=A0A1L9QPI9_9CYAN|nr:ATP-binding protein [Roseofilum reptotaenium]MDB9519551.1 ATP-binding protein [Roseofilum reptotaenium CS-1145]OJJ24552.1 hypothetical protein BI308_16210 [Roseofilum reptotaenium AO1-A]
MNASSHASISTLNETSLSNHLETGDLTPPSLSELGAELSFIHNTSGEYLAFQWTQGERYDLAPESLVGQLMENTLYPIPIDAYLDRVRQVLENKLPDRFSYPFQYGECYFLFDLVVTPVLTSPLKANQVLVLGRLLSSAVGSQSFASSSDPPQQGERKTSDHYQTLLTRITRKIRRTLDLETICNQTVEGLGIALNLESCAIAQKCLETEHLKVVAHYTHQGGHSQVGRLLPLEKNSPLIDALSSLDPLAWVESEDKESLESRLAVATGYKDRPNGLLLLSPPIRSDPDQAYLWSAEEIELVRELADQVGTAIAHATLYQELELAREQAEEASRLKSEFLANTSHELRTPLNGMIGFLKLILDEMADDPEEQMEWVQEAHKSALHLLNLINDVLDLARIEAGKMQIDISPVNLDELLTNLDNFTRPQAETKGLSYEISRTPTRDEVMITGNYQRLLQVLLNLVGNAVKFTHEGGITITAEVIAKKFQVGDREHPGFVKVSVADTGIGVPLEKQEQLFQNFSQVDGSRTRQYGGTGLGLAISQRLIETMGGEVNFFSMGEGLGSTVTFTAPLGQLPVIVKE